MNPQRTFSFGAPLIAAGAVALLGGTAWGTAILNPSFEIGAGPDAADWTEIEVAGGGLGASATTDRVNTDPNTGDFSMFFSVVGAADFGPVAEIQQQTLVGSVIGGQTYDFSFYTKGNAGPGTVAFYEVSWFDGDGSDGGGPQGSATGLQNFSPSLGGTYTQVTNNGLVAPASADSVFVQIRLVTGAFDGAIGSAYVDDVSFAPIPEPSSTGLAALGAAAFLLRRRRA